MSARFVTAHPRLEGVIAPQFLPAPVGRDKASWQASRPSRRRIAAKRGKDARVRFGEECREVIRRPTHASYTPESTTWLVAVVHRSQKCAPQEAKRRATGSSSAGVSPCPRVIACDCAFSRFTLSRSHARATRCCTADCPAQLPRPHLVVAPCMPTFDKTPAHVKICGLAVGGLRRSIRPSCPCVGRLTASPPEQCGAPCRAANPALPSLALAPFCS